MNRNILIAVAAVFVIAGVADQPPENQQEKPALLPIGTRRASFHKKGSSWLRCNQKSCHPYGLDGMLRDSDAHNTHQVMDAVLKLKKLVLEPHCRAYEGGVEQGFPAYQASNVSAADGPWILIKSGLEKHIVVLSKMPGSGLEEDYAAQGRRAGIFVVCLIIKTELCTRQTNGGKP